MPFEELSFPVLNSLVIGFILGFYYIKAQIIAIEDKFRAKLMNGRLRQATRSGKILVNCSRSTLKEKIVNSLLRCSLIFYLIQPMHGLLAHSVIILSLTG